MKRTLVYLSQSVQRSTETMLKFILTSLPISLQYRLRDLGFLGWLSDFGAIIAVPGIALAAPRVVYNTFRNWFSSRFLLVGNKSQRHPGLEVHHLAHKPEDIESRGDARHKVLLFVHGGAWGSGQLWQYRQAAIRYGELLGMHTVVLLKYAYYPQAGIINQRDALLAAVQFINGSPSEIVSSERSRAGASTSSHPTQSIQLTLCGHSSGAHLCVMALVEVWRREIANNDNALSAHTQPLIHSIIGLSGPYDLVKHFQFESGRGVQHISPMQGAAGGYDGLAGCSPDLLVQSEIGKVSADALALKENSAVHSRVYLLHGTEDETVPHEASQRMALALRSAAFNHVYEHYYSVEFCFVKSRLQCLILAMILGWPFATSNGCAAEPSSQWHLGCLGTNNK